jgi:hypothetical protein
MTRKYFAFSVGALMTLGVANAYAQGGPGIGTPLISPADRGSSRVGTRGANFLEIGLGARAMGMAGAYASLAEGMSSLYWNLAGTAEVQNAAGGINFSSLYGQNGLDFMWGGALMPMAGGVIGIQVGQMSSGKLTRTTYEYPDGGDPTVGSSFEFTGTMAGLSYARRLTDRLNVGFGAKFASEGIPGATASYIGGDFGVKFRTGLYGTTLGAALANVGSSGSYRGRLVRANTFDTFTLGVVPVEYQVGEFEMPTMFRFSVMADLIGGPDALVSQRSDMGGFRAVLEFANAMDTDLQYALGGEYSFREMLFLRAGRRWLNEGWDKQDGANLPQSEYWKRGLAFGGGVKLPFAGRHLGFDYAWNGQGELPSNSHFTFELGF